jgi:hypothetical protein
MADCSAGEELDGRAADDLHAVILAAIEHHLRKDGKVRRCAEETGMSGYAAQSVRVLVVDFSAQWIAARRGDFRRCDPITEGISGTIESVVHAERRKNAAVEKLVEWLTGNDFNEQAEEVGAQVGVDVAAARSGLEMTGNHRGTCFERRVGNPPDVTASGQA